MLGNNIDQVIADVVKGTLNAGSFTIEPDYVATDTIGEMIEKLAILHIRVWHLEDAIAAAKTDEEVAELKRKIDICFKVKRPALVAAINLLINDAIIKERSLVEPSVKHYKGFK